MHQNLASKPLSEDLKRRQRLQDTPEIGLSYYSPRAVINARTLEAAQFGGPSSDSELSEPDELFEMDSSYRISFEKGESDKLISQINKPINVCGVICFIFVTDYFRCLGEGKL
jgi:hypothetical protein